MCLVVLGPFQASPGLSHWVKVVLGSSGVSSGSLGVWEGVLGAMQWGTWSGRRNAFVGGFA